MSLGKRTRELRKKRDLSQSELGSMLNLSFGGVSAIESGRSNPSAETIIKLAEIFNVTADYLLTGKESTNEIDDTEYKAIELMRKDTDFKSWVLEYYDSKKKMFKQAELLKKAA